MKTPLWRRRAWWGVLAAVLIGHTLVTHWLQAALAPLDTRPALERMQATYSRVLQTSREAATAAPAAPAEGAPRAAQRRRALAAAQAASAAAEAASAPVAAASAAETVAQAAPESAASATSAVAQAASGAEGAASGSGAGAALAAAVPPASSASGPAPYTWPTSTRLRYALQGWFRGEVTGQAQVEWLRVGERYQVHLDVSVGPSFAPLMTRRMSSEGRVSPAGLLPSRYEQVTSQVIGRDKRVQLRFDDQGVLLDRGNRVPSWPDVQDTASQFIQMVYLFTTQPALRTAGSRVEFGLALPNRVDRWIYEVGVSEIVSTPAGEFLSFHVVPRRAAAKGDLSAEIWYAPQLQMLPVRIRITQDADTWIDLRLSQAPDVS